ncbi:MAG: HIT domain-containing protein [Nitrospirae bacterium]|nr:HIT domain-containing protein [Nitrospirota bacterium]
MEYIQRGNSGGCIFCTLPAAKRDEENLILARARHGFVIMNRYPYSNAHVMVAPYEHTSDLLGVSEEARGSLMTLVGHAIRILQTAYKADGLNIGANLGRAAGAGYDGHLHFHVVPRWLGDTNFMPILGETKVITQSLSDTYRQLLPHFQAVSTA